MIAERLLEETAVPGRDTSGFRDPDFVALCDLVLEAWSLRRSPLRLVRRVLGARARIRAGVAAVRRLPELTVALTGSPDGREMLGNLTGRRMLLPRSRAVSVLEIPADPADYQRGRSKQALRTNCRKARDAGVVCRLVDAPEALRRGEEMLLARGEPSVIDHIRRHAEQRIGRFWLAEDAGGETLVMAVVTVDRWVARLDWMATAPRQDRSDARYLLSAHIVEWVAAQGIGHLAVESCLLLPPGLRHFQERLGFRPTNLTVIDGDRPPATEPEHDPVKVRP